MNYIKLIIVLLAALVMPALGQGSELPDVLVKMPESEHAIIVEKKTQTLFVYGKDQGEIRLVSTYPCSTGEVGGPKEKAGDKKTPEGVYFLKDEYEDRYLTPIYGKKAFPSDYPNFLDLRQGKQGSAIWIHGTDKVLKPMDSNGCVAMENDNIMSLADKIRLDATPLIIVEQMGTASLGSLAQKRATIDRFLENWVSAMRSGSYHLYLSHYAEDYLPEISWWENWLKMRRAAADKKLELTIRMDNTGIYAHGDTVVALMDMSVSSPEQKTYLGKRQLFIRMSSTGPAIVGDLFQKTAKPFQTGEVPLVAAARTLTRDQSDSEAVVETVEQWLAAWSAKDMAEYAAFYASDFVSEGLGKAAWVRRKKSLAKRYDYIHVTGKDYQVVQKKDGYVVSFLQQYKSSGFSTQGRKQLKLVNKGGAWKIYRENWKGK